MEDGWPAVTAASDAKNQPSDEAEMRAMRSASNDAIARGDVTTLASFLTEDFQTTRPCATQPPTSRRPQRLPALMQ